MTLAVARGMEMAAVDPLGLGQALAESEFTDGEIMYLAVIVGGAVGKIKAPDEGGKRSVRTEAKQTDVESWLDARLLEELGDGVKRIARGKTYASPSGTTFHTRTMVPHPRGGGEASCFYGLAEDKWIAGDVFVLAFGTEAVLVVPVADWVEFKGQTPSSVDASSGLRVYKPTLWKTATGCIELRVGGEHVDASRWVDNWGALQ